MIKAMKHNQNGFVAIFTAIIIMGLLTLVAIGFTNITRQAQRRTLDDQLNTQAFYAAETGINRARELINTGAVGIDDNKSDCADNGSYNYDIDTTLGINISCLLINMTPPTVEYDSVPVVGDGESITTYLRTLPSSGANISTLEVSWDTDQRSDLTDPDDERPNQGFTNSSPTLLPAANWGDNIGVLRVDLVRAPSPVTAANLERANLVNNSYTFFLYPSRQASTNSFTANPGSAGGHGASFLTNCVPNAADFRCVARINLSGAASNGYYVRLQSYYNPVRVSLRPLDGSGNETLTSGSQAIIDATGRASDVSRRVQVRVPIRNSNNSFPGYHSPFSILSAGSICKRLVGVPGNSTFLSTDVPASEQALCNPAMP